mgnify:CR=1 FL=1
MKKTNILLIIILFSNICFGQEKWLIKNPNSFDYYITTEIKDGEIRAQTQRHQVGGEQHIRLPTELAEECREEDSVLFPSQQDSSHQT